MLHGSDVVHYLHQLHHPTVFVIQEMAMEHVLPGEIRKLGQYLYVDSRWNREIIPPYPRRRQLNRIASGCFHFHNLERIDVDVERMRKAGGIVVIQSPQFRSSE